MCGRDAIGAMLAIGFTVLGMAASAESHRTIAQFAITGDADAGERTFRKCQACHEVGAGAVPKAGPVLNGVLGRAAGTYPDFAYSPALLAAASEQDLIWNPQTLDAFLSKPKEFIDGTKMTFVGLRKDADRANIIAYLATFLEEEN